MENQMMRFFIQTNDLFGNVDRFGPAVAADNPVAGVNALISTGIILILGFGGVAALIFMLWGAFDYITSGGEQEKVEKARQKLTYAAAGVILLIVALSAWVLIVVDILGIFKRDGGGGWQFSIPTMGCTADGAKCDPATPARCCSGKCTGAAGSAVCTK